MVGLFAVTVVAFTAALLMDALFLALGFFVLGLVLAFVMAIAWSRPEGHPTEHHAPSDRIVKDTAP